jgi:hypothetical protein
MQKGVPFFLRENVLQVRNARQHFVTLPDEKKAELRQYREPRANFFLLLPLKLMAIYEVLAARRRFTEELQTRRCGADHWPVSIAYAAGLR